MAIHYLDEKRKANPEKPIGNPYRLLGVNHEGIPYFYWSPAPGEFVAYFGPQKEYRVWGKIQTAKHGKGMLPENRAFIADLETAKELEKLGVVRPCKICNKDEAARYEKDASLRLNPAIKPA